MRSGGRARRRGAGWRAADWSSAKLLPSPAAAPQPIVAIYAARVGRWRGIFAHHSWIVVPAPARRGTPVTTRSVGAVPCAPMAGPGRPLVRQCAAADPRHRRGRCSAADRENPGRGRLLSLPRMGRLPGLAGSELQHLRGACHAPVPELAAVLPDRDRQGLATHDGSFRTDPEPHRNPALPRGFAGVAIGWIEGIEVNFLGLIAGLDVRRPAIKLPGWGRIGLDPVIW